MQSKIIFLDRDGVINKDSNGGYVTCWDEFQFLPNSLEAIRKLTELGFEIIIISNQAGVSKGIYSAQTLEEITRNMLDRIIKAGGRIRDVHYCEHRDEEDCQCRKPKSGLFKQAVMGKAVDIPKIIMIGDAQRDVQAAQDFGCKTILVLSGKTQNEEEVNDFKYKPDFIAQDLLDAVDIIIEKNL